MYSGLIGLGGTIYSASKATLKADKVVKSAKEDIIVIETLEDPAYSEQDRKEDLRKVYIQTGLEVAKLYLPTLGLGILSFGGIVGSHYILRDRNASLAAAYASLYQAYREYQKKVKNLYGEDAEKDIRYNLSGDDSKIKIIEDMNSPLGSPYARYFDENCEGYDENPQLVMMFLYSQQSHFNDELTSKEHLYLNYAYKSLGMKETKMGQSHGWIRDKNDPGRSNFVDLEVIPVKVRNTDDDKDWKPWKYIYIVDFNPDGYILDDLVRKNRIEG